MQYYYIDKNDKKWEIDADEKIIDFISMGIKEIILPPKAEIIGLGRNDIKELIVPKSCKELYCRDNELTKLQFLGKPLRVACQGNHLTELIIPEGCVFFNCSDNKITSLTGNLACDIIDCQENNLTELKTKPGCKYLYCNDNRITTLKVNEGILELNCNNNGLTSLEVPISCETLYCTRNKITKLLIPENCDVSSDRNVQISYVKTLTPNFGKTDKAISNLILKIKNPVLWSIADQLTKVLPDLGVNDFIDIKQLKKLANQNATLGQMLSKKEGQTLLTSKQNKGLTLKDIQLADFYDKLDLLQNKNIEIAHSVRKGDQIYFKDKTNHVFQVNLKPFKTKEILDNLDTKEDYDLADNLEHYISQSNHPTSRKTLTVARVRYTYLEDRNAIVLDEIQTDLDDNDFLGKDLMAGWEEFTMKLFIQYVRKQYKIRKIYMPTYDSKKKLYDANPPMYLYKELPNKFGFKKTSDLEGFMVLEKFELPSFEDFGLLTDI